MPLMYRERYEPVALAGRGAQGEVWKAHDHLHDRPVALKIRDATGVDRDVLLGEARTLLAMRPHEALPLVRDDFFADDRYVITMDWIEGRSLATLREPSFEEVYEHLRTVAAALDHLHAHTPPIVHRDVKPQNVVITDDGRTVLVDFGLAGSARTPYLDGTPAYTAPEVAAGRGATPASDVFAFAVTAFVALSGAFPVPGGDVDLSVVPERFRDNVRRALGEGLSIDPAMRPATAGELVRAMAPADTPNNLPAELSSFVGRVDESIEIRRSLSSSRLVTLVGTGGAGKTRLGVHVARSSLAAFPDGVWLAELAGVTDGEFVGPRVALAIGVRTDTREEVTDALAESLSTGNQLLVLDNCEHVIDACAHLAEALLRACPRLTILATSREALRIPGEAAWSIGSLDDDASVDLFRERARMAAPAPDDGLVRDVCRRLDGIPLALELAAAQLGTMSLEDLSASLDRVLGVLTGGVRTNPRQESMQATIEWSHGLLPAAEQEAFRRLSVFAGGFTAAAAAEVSTAAGLLPRLVETSLVGVQDDRFRLLEPVRQFAASKLVEAGEQAEFLAAHVRWVELLVATEGDVTTVDWLDRLGAEHDNIEAALVHAIDADPGSAGRIVHTASEYWKQRGYWTELRVWARRVLETDGPDDATRAYLLYRTGDVALDQGDTEEGTQAIETSAETYRRIGDDRGLAVTLLSLAKAKHTVGDINGERAHLLESLELSRATGHRTAEAAALNNLGIVHYSLGEFHEAIAALEQSMAIQRERGDRTYLAFLSINLSALYEKVGDVAEARRLSENGLVEMDELGNDQGRRAALIQLAQLDLAEGRLDDAAERAARSIEICTRLNDRAAEMYPVRILANVAHARGDLDEASALHDRALVLCREIGAALEVAVSLSESAFVDLARGDAGSAVRRFGEAHGIRTISGVPAEDDPAVAEALEEARTALGPKPFEREWESGRRAATARPT